MITPERRIVAFVGMAGSGKGTCAEYVVRSRNVPLIYFGGLVYDEVARRGLDIVRDEKTVRENMRATDGPAVLAKRVAAKIEDYSAAGHSRIVLDGLYSWSEYKFLRETFGDQLTMIATTLPRALRYQRVINRGDAHRKYNLEQIQARDIAEIENLEKGGPIAMADFTLLNTTTQDDLIAQLEHVLKEIDF